ncbi:endo alpha-1,4 polygalactosaminidase [Longispora sp. K20-0274]|uniref:endo alpha-1,4 polygalactosaminidase n=1 Tax=Longispora sp. K20-0274 TaxID=3088255 RepID=UPI00399994A5
MRRCLALLLVLSVAGCTSTAGGAPRASPTAVDPPASGANPSDQGNMSPGPTRTAGPKPTPGKITSWVYQLQGYPGGRLDDVAKAPGQLAVVDLARDAKSDYFRADEVAALKRSGKTVLAYFEIGSIENFRPEYPGVKDLVLNRWDAWPEEYFVRYWEPAWWDKVVRPRLDQAARAGFDGVYLDTPLAYEEIDLKTVQGESRESLGRKMADLIVRIAKYSPLLVFPQNSPELRKYSGYTEAIDGIGMEELFFLATDKPCDESFCPENLGETRALRKAGKTVLAVDYATRPENVRKACASYAAEDFAGYVTTRALDTITRSCA